MSHVLFLVGLLLMLSARLVWLRAMSWRQLSGLPSGRLLYADTPSWTSPDRPLVSTRYHLAGRPDYLVEISGHAIPVEVKSMPRPPVVYPSHQLQLAAYCLLVEDAFGQSPPYGMLRYRDGTVSINYTPELRAELLAMLEDMRKDREARWVPRSHDSPARCRSCGLHSYCSDALAS